MNPFCFCIDFYRFYKIPILIPINPFKGAIGPWWPPREIWHIKLQPSLECWDGWNQFDRWRAMAHGHMGPMGPIFNPRDPIFNPRGPN